MRLISHSPRSLWVLSQVSSRFLLIFMSADLFLFFEYSPLSLVLGEICYPSYTHFAGNGATVERIGAPRDAGERRALS